MPRIRRLMTRRMALRFAIVSLVFVAAACEPFDSCFGGGTVLQVTPVPTPVITTAPTTAATSAATSAATAAASGTPAAAGTAFSGAAKLGVDHPPFLVTTYPPGGKSYVLFCGTITGANGGTLTAGLSGTTGQAATAAGAIGADGKYSIAVPIQQFGSLTASSVTVKNAAGTQLIGTIAPVSITVGADDAACTP